MSTAGIVRHGTTMNPGTIKCIHCGEMACIQGHSSTKLRMRCRHCQTSFTIDKEVLRKPRTAPGGPPAAPRTVPEFRPISRDPFAHWRLAMSGRK